MIKYIYLYTIIFSSFIFATANENFKIIKNTNDSFELTFSLSDIEIEEKDRENFPNPNGGFYEKRIDTENAKVFDNFLDAMVKLNEKAKQGLGDGGQETTL